MRNNIIFINLFIAQYVVVIFPYQNTAIYYQVLKECESVKDSKCDEGISILTKCALIVLRTKIIDYRGKAEEL